MRNEYSKFPFFSDFFLYVISKKNTESGYISIHSIHNGHSISYFCYCIHVRHCSEHKSLSEIEERKGEEAKKKKKLQLIRLNSTLENLWIDWPFLILTDFFRSALFVLISNVTEKEMCLPIESLLKTSIDRLHGSIENWEEMEKKTESVRMRSKYLMKMKTRIDRFHSPNRKRIEKKTKSLYCWLHDMI